MKRSDMVKFIATKLYYGSLAARVDSNDLTIIALAENDAEDVLKVIEEWRMKAPRYIACMANGKKYNKETDPAHDVIDIEAWEPENE